MAYKTTSVLLVEGYGWVGTLIASHLARSERYTIAGRNKDESTAAPVSHARGADPLLRAL